MIQMLWICFGVCAGLLLFLRYRKTGIRRYRRTGIFVLAVTAVLVALYLSAIH